MKILRCRIFLIALFFWVNSSKSQDIKVNDLCLRIDNSQINFELYKKGDSRLKDNLFSNQIVLVSVTSLNIDSLLLSIGKSQLIENLYSCFQSETKDWYSNLILYQITDRDASIFISIDSREKWLRFQKENDRKYWDKYLKKHTKIK